MNELKTLKERLNFKQEGFYQLKDDTSQIIRRFSKQLDSVNFPAFETNLLQGTEIVQHVFDCKNNQFLVKPNYYNWWSYANIYCFYSELIYKVDNPEIKKLVSELKDYVTSINNINSSLNGGVFTVESFMVNTLTEPDNIFGFFPTMIHNKFLEIYTF